MMRKIIIIIASVLASFFASAAEPLTLEQCIEMALERNRSLKQGEIQKAVQVINYEQARKDLLPNLNASANQSFNFGRSLGADNVYQSTNSSNTSFGLSSNINLFDGLRMKYNIDARRHEMETSVAEMEKLKHDIALSVSSGFLQVLLNKELLLLAQQQLEFTETKIDERRKMIENGKMAEGEMFELLAQQAKEKQQNIQSEIRLKLALLDLAQIIEYPDFETLDVKVPHNLMNNELSMLDANAVLKNAAQNHPDVVVAQRKIESAATNIKIAKSLYYPSLGFGAQIGSGYYRLSAFPNDPFSKQVNNNLSTSLGFNLNIPIFNRFETQSRIKTAQLNANATTLQLETVKQQLQKTVQQAYQNALGAKASWDAAEQSVFASREALRFVDRKFELGNASVYELFMAKNNLSFAESEIVQAKYEYAFRLKILELLNTGISD